MQDNRNIENVVQEIMGLVDDIIGCDSAGYQFECKRQIQSKLRELAESKFSPEDQYVNDILVWNENVYRAVKEAANVMRAYDCGVLDTLTAISSVNQKGENMQENLIKLHSIILDGDLTEAAKLCDELIAAAQQGVPELTLNLEEIREIAIQAGLEEYGDVIDSGMEVYRETLLACPADLRDFARRILATRGSFYS